jgi:hypothetical protein
VRNAISGAKAALFLHRFLQRGIHRDAILVVDDIEKAGVAAVKVVGRQAMQRGKIA